MTSLSLTATLRDATIIFLASAGVSFVCNRLRSNPIPIIRREPYEIFKPCAEPSGQVMDLDPQDLLVHDNRTLIIDARSREEFSLWHLQGAVNLPYDYLIPTPDSQINALANRGSARVVVYGDGDNPDSGRELGRELAGKGIRNVFVLLGGAPALRTRQHPNPGEAP